MTRGPLDEILDEDPYGHGRRADRRPDRGRPTGRYARDDDLRARPDEAYSGRGDARRGDGGRGPDARGGDARGGDARGGDARREGARGGGGGGRGGDARRAYTDPDYADPEYAGPGYADPDYDDRGYADADYGDPGYGESGYDDPENSDAEYADPEYGDPDYADSGYAEPRHADPEYADSARTNRRRGSRGRVDPDARHADREYTDDDADHGDAGYADDARRRESRRANSVGASPVRGDTGRGDSGRSDPGHSDDADADGGWSGGWDTDDESAPSRRTRALPKLVAVLVVVAALLGLGIVGIGKVVGRVGGGSSAADYTGSGDGIAVVQVPDGASAREIAQELHDANVTASVAAFVKAASANPKSLGIQPGTYRLRNRMSASAALTALLDPASSAPFRFTIKEGMSVQQVLAGLHDRLGTPMDELEAIARNPAQLGVPSYALTLEGYFFPSTYDLVPGATPVQLMTSFVTRFKKETASLDIEHRAAAQGMTPAKIVTIASIIEKEVANADEGPKVARVIYNRLNDTSGRFRRIDMDSTTRYGESEYTGPLSDAQLRSSNPYNTRKVPGLPPGAISNPGLWALKSALEPATGTWFYFLSMPRSKVTLFATTEAEFDNLNRQYRAEGGRE